MEQIRVVLAEIPRLLREIVHSVLAAAPDVVLVGTLDGARLRSGELGRMDAEVLIVAMEPRMELRELDELLYEQPRLKVFAIAVDGRGAFLYALRPHAEPLGDVSPDRLVQAIRSAVPRGTA